MFIHFRSFLENHTPFHSKMSKIYTRFQIDTAANTYPLGRHIPILLILGSIPSGGLAFPLCALVNSLQQSSKKISSPFY